MTMTNDEILNKIEVPTVGTFDIGQNKFFYQMVVEDLVRILNETGGSLVEAVESLNKELQETDGLFPETFRVSLKN